MLPEHKRVKKFLSYFNVYGKTAFFQFKFLISFCSFLTELR